jgi:hypothetical protein
VLHGFSAPLLFDDIPFVGPFFSTHGTLAEKN